MGTCTLACHLAIGTSTFCTGRCYYKYALDDYGWPFYQIVYSVHRHASQCKTTIFVCSFDKDCARFHTPLVPFNLVTNVTSKLTPLLEAGLQALSSGMPESSTAPLTRRMVYERLHLLLQQILSLIPTLPSTLQPLLVYNFPHKRQNKVSQITYIRNLLRVTEYCPELSERILATIIDRAIQIDVRFSLFEFKCACNLPAVSIGGNTGRIRRNGRSWRCS